MQRRRCPNCHAPLPIGFGVCFDIHNNVLCAKCGKPIIAATAIAEQEITNKTTSFTPNPSYGPQPQKQPFGPVSAPWTEGEMDGYQDGPHPHVGHGFRNFPDICM